MRRDLREKRIQISMTPKEHRALLAIAKQNGESVAYIAYALMRGGLEQYEKEHQSSR